ncbi:general secretion pathway protein GspG [Rhodoferax lacus]|uniref:General secretion pathway protein GspG n=1 Tax=Rhodoferax lacus TaxID=2184758 RepID=A0A3E1R960_9BURK|nr:type II secretion system protein [Rhodoferax lacus]RFO95783.1 general secretion pathway protein GspG [Rhodoferax lacus]
MKQQASSKRVGGFTLIELVVTVAIIGVLALVATPLGTLSVQRLREGELRSNLRQIREALDAYKRASDSGKVARRADGTGYPRTLEELEAGVVDAKNPNKAKIYFLRRLPRDPFFADANVPAAATWGKRSYASAPDMPSEGEDVFDVYSRSERVGLNGTPLRDW